MEFESFEIRETPPTVEELQAMYEAKGDLKPLFNSSGVDYRSMGLKDKLAHMSTDEAFALMQENGNLVKRPFLIGDTTHLLGFKLAEWELAF